MSHGENTTAKAGVKYRANLQRVGSLVPETIILLQEYARVKDWGKVRHLAIQENILGKRSPHTVDFILREVKRRMFQHEAELPRAELVAELISKDTPLATKSQILLIYLCKSDALVEQLILRLVKPRLAFRSQQQLSSKDVYDFLMEERKDHPELSRWSEYLRRRWSRGFLALLRDFGFMESAPSRNLTKPTVRVDTFAFFLLHLLKKKLPASNILGNWVWDMFLLSEEEKEGLLAETQKRGWVSFLKAGEVVELSFRYRSLEEWLDELG